MSDELNLAFAQAARSLSEHYLVPDLLLPNTRVIFVLESPHVQELKYGAPVSGPSGATMTKHLFGESYARFPLGRLVKRNADEEKHRPRLDRIGLLNVSNVPLQASAYDSLKVQQEYAEWLQAMGSLRSSNQQTEYRDERVQAVQSVLVASLRHKLQALTERECVMVPCGRFAQKFFRLAAVSSPSWTVIDQVPHPSYNSWDRAQYQPVIARVCAALNQGMTDEETAAGLDD